jgi:hypothetical protein
MGDDSRRRATVKITIESTSKVVKLDGIDCRVWEGETEGGVKIHAFIPRIGAADDQDLSQFEAELEEMRAPSAAVQMYPVRLIL